MSFLKKIFGPDKPEPEADPLPWINAADNPWGIPILDIRPVTQNMTSTSTNPVMAANAVSYGGEDGTVFWNGAEVHPKQHPKGLSFPIDGSLEPGVLFVPGVMEQKWAIFFDGENLLFVRSWQRQVFVSARTTQENNRLTVREFGGTFVPDQPDLTAAILRFLLISHVAGAVVPAPVPGSFTGKTRDAAMWAFSAYGNMAQYAVFDTSFAPPCPRPLRSHSLLHIAVARNEPAAIRQQFERGIRLDSLAGDGLAPLHWAIAPKSTVALETLLSLGAGPDVRSKEGATPIMNAVQSDRHEHLLLLLQAGASVNAVDDRGFTALHRAAEMGKEDFVRLLLEQGADKSIDAEGHTALSLARQRGQQGIIDLLLF